MFDVFFGDYEEASAFLGIVKICGNDVYLGIKRWEFNNNIIHHFWES